MNNKEKAITLLQKADIIRIDDMFTDNHEFDNDSPMLEVSIRDFYDNLISYSFNDESFENCVISGNVISMVDNAGKEADIYCFNVTETEIKA
jgi:hypothetical protein